MTHHNGNAPTRPQPAAPHGTDTTSALRALPPPPRTAPQVQTVMNGTPAQVALPLPKPPPQDFDSRATTQAPMRAPHHSTVPTAASIPPPGRAKGKSAGLVVALTLLAVMAIGGIGFGAFVALRHGGVESAVVRVATPGGNGTGFFIEGPDHYAYVATAFHVVERGEAILIERSVPAGDDHYVEAYPETEVVAFDAEADIAIIRIKNLAGDHFKRLPLAEQPMANEEVKSFGFPGSNITRRTGLIAKDGKLLSLVKFPVYDRRNARVVRDSAIDGLLVSTEIEPGFSGGPTVNADGEVVGINVTKDLVHRGQNGVVHVKLLKSLLETVKPAAETAEPTPEEVAKLLERLEAEVLLLPVDDRIDTSEHSFISAAELPRLRELIDEIRRHERDSVPAPGRKLSGRAALGMWAAQMPANPLETYLSSKVQETISKCELSSTRLVGLFADVADDDKEKQQAQQAALERCDELALRPLAWDLLASTMQWTGKERSFSVTKVERVDDSANVFRAMVKVSGLDNLLPLWLTTDYGELRVKLFDKEGKLYGVKSAAKVDASQLAGEWEIKQPRAPAMDMTDAESERTETVSVSVSGSEVSIRHEVDAHLYNTARGVFRCSARREIDGGMVQAFSGKLEDGVIVAKPKEDARATGSDARCKWGYRPDAMAVFKLLDGKLVMYHTDGSIYPESVQLVRKAATPKDEGRAEHKEG